MKPGPRELPIIFTAESVRAILAGAKTQTRRLIRWPEWVSDEDKLKLAAQRPCTGLAYYVDGRPRRIFAPRYRVGDVLWVKEEWKTDEIDGADGIRFRADGEFRPIANTQAASDAWVAADRRRGGWRSPLYMPRWASRIEREVTEVRAQRVQDISEEDARAEGFVDPCRGACGQTVRPGPREAFATAWDRINRKRSPWSRNDWVFAYTFRRQP